MYRWMSGEKKFCFVTLRTEAEAEKGPHSAPSNWRREGWFFDRGIRCAGLQLNDIQLMGRPLRIGRPACLLFTRVRALTKAFPCQDGHRTTSPLRRRCDQTLFPTQPFQPCP